jgi:hypothetical protein
MHEISPTSCAYSGYRRIGNGDDFAVSEIESCTLIMKRRITANNDFLSHTAIERANESYRLTLPAPKVLAQINVTDLQERLVL